MSNEPKQPAQDVPEPGAAATAGQAGAGEPAAEPGGASPAAPATPAPTSPANPATPADPATAGKAADPATPANPVNPAAPANPATPAATHADEAATAADLLAGRSAATPPAAPAGGAGQQRYLVSPDDEERDEPAKAGNRAKPVLFGVLALVLIVAGFFAVRYFVTNNATAAAGDCVSLTEQSDDRADVKTLDCDDDKASYQVGKVLDNAEAVCPEEGLYTEVSPSSSVGDGYKLCLLPNMAEGACYVSDDGMGFVKGDCTSPDALKVTQVIKGSNDLGRCPDSAGMAYPEPAVTYCVAPADL
ncbi:LppU/SCO3897 family protein [Saccharothrix algeriensis]|uniref:Uncharacterized protein n=2 Tax=Saccharothrix algeriensis TaxID=173560 RepID=A0ABS2S7B2_9PSEU|nr:hypothetical protein [Saccharothrix algeriensis]MBM7811720.1 hypothetical protein [Saccharothrix algeriensis]